MKGETSKAFFFLPFFKHDVSRVQESDLVTVAGDTEQVAQSLKTFLSVTVFGPSVFFIFNIIKKKKLSVLEPLYYISWTSEVYYPCEEVCLCRPLLTIPEITTQVLRLVHRLSDC